MRRQRWSSRRGMSATAVALLVSLPMLVPQSADAQQGRRGGGPGSPGLPRAEMMQRVQAQINSLMQEALGLTAEQVQSVDEITNRFRMERSTLLREERALQQGIGEGGRVFRRNWVVPDLTDEQAREILAQQEEIREREAALFREEQAALLEVISPAQLLGIYHFRAQINERIRRIERTQGTGRGGGTGSDILPEGGGLQ